MEWNAESVLDALNEFERKSEIPEILDQYLERIAKNGEVVFPWIKLKPLLKKKLEFVLDEFYETCPVETTVPVPNSEAFNFDNLKKGILSAVEEFTSAPFTIQRLCELVTNPTKHYNRTDKYMRGIEKNILVVSTIEPRSEQDPNNPVVNGVDNDSPNDTLNGHEPGNEVTTINLNTPANHVLLENFANVFPSAVCIPQSADSFADQETVPVERIEGTNPPKEDDEEEEEMDTMEDEEPSEEEEKQDIQPEESSNASAPETLQDDSASQSTAEPDTTQVAELVGDGRGDATSKEEKVVDCDSTLNAKPEEPSQDSPTKVSNTVNYTKDVASVIDTLYDYINKVSDDDETVLEQPEATQSQDSNEESLVNDSIEEPQETESVAEFPMDSESAAISAEPDQSV